MLWRRTLAEGPGVAVLPTRQLAEDLDAAPIWVFNSGQSHLQWVPPESLGPFIADVLDGLHFARADEASPWGALRAAMGHPQPFPLRHVAIGNEDCGLPGYRGEGKGRARGGRCC